MKAIKFSISTILILGSSLGLSSAATYIYNIGDAVGSFGTSLDNDSWSTPASESWVVSAFSGVNYARNQTGSDSSIYRPNDTSFTFTIPALTTQLNLEISARSGTGFWQAGLAQGQTPRFGIGADFGDNDKAFIFDNGSRRAESGTSATGDSNVVYRVEYDLIEGTANLFRNGSLIIEDQTISNTPIGTLSGTNSLFIRTNSVFRGPSEFRIEVIPEPSSAAFLCGALSLMMLRKRRG